MTSSTWSQYSQKIPSEMRPYVVGEPLDGITISNAQRHDDHPKEGDMIAHDPLNHADQWLVTKDYFQNKFEPARADLVELFGRLVDHVLHYASMPHAHSQAAKDAADARAAILNIKPTKAERQRDLSDLWKLACGMDRPWPLFSVIEKLCEAVKHLHDAHQCDGDGHEQFYTARAQAEILLPRIRRALAVTVGLPVSPVCAFLPIKPYCVHPASFWKQHRDSLGHAFTDDQIDKADAGNGYLGEWAGAQCVVSTKIKT